MSYKAREILQSKYTQNEAVVELIFKSIMNVANFVTTGPISYEKLCCMKLDTDWMKTGESEYNGEGQCGLDELAGHRFICSKA